MGVTVLTAASGNALGSRQVFDKLDAFSPAFVKTAADAISIKAGTVVAVADVVIPFVFDTPVTMPTLTAGADYAVYVCSDGSVLADTSFSAPTGYTTANSRQIGGFHYSLVAAGETVAGGSFSTASPSMVWTQTDVDKIAGINSYSIWDLKFRPVCSSPKGMAFVNNVWIDIYLCSTDADTNGTSKAGTDIASGSVLPKIPVKFGGNGTTTYSSMTWWVASELARSAGKRLMFAHEFADAAFGVTESQSIDATASTYPATQRNAGYTSKCGLEQATGHQWVWGLDSGTQASAFSWADQAGGRGQLYQNTPTKVLLGGSRTYNTMSGSRSAIFNNAPWLPYWFISLRAAAEHFQV